MSREEFFNVPLDSQADINLNKVFVLVIYDISDTRKRNKLIKVLKGYGQRIQKSAFEAIIKRAKLKKLLERIERLMADDDTPDDVRVYMIRGNGAVKIYGRESLVTDKEVYFV
jgi:CRISPR-associated endonuclease Cas2